MINCYIDKNLMIYKDGKVVDITQKKMCAVLAFFLIEKEATRERIANIFYNGNKNTIRNAMYMINKVIGEPILINKDRHNIILNPKLDINVNLNYESDEILKSLNIKSDLFIEWRLSVSDNTFYIHQNTLNKIIVNLQKSEQANMLVKGRPEVGKRIFAKKIIEGVEDTPKCNILCLKEEQHFTLNTMYLIFKYLNKYSKSNILRTFNDIVFHNEEAFFDDNSLLNLHYIPFETLLVEIIQTEVKRRCVVVIEDAHWIDKSSLEIIEEITNDNDCLLDFILIYDPTVENNLSTKLNHFEAFELNFWSEDKLCKYLKEYHSSIASECHNIMKHTDGSVLGVDLTIDSLTRDGSMLSHSAVIESRLSSMSDIEKAVIEYISIFNFAPTLNDIFNEFGKYDIESVLSNLEDSKIIFFDYRSEICYVFLVHSKLKKAVYNNIETERKQYFHNKIASELETVRTKGNIKQVYDIYSHYKRTANIIKESEYKLKLLSIVSSYTHSYFPITNTFDFITSDQFTEKNIYEELSNMEKFIEENQEVKLNDTIMIDFLLLKNRINITTGKTEGVYESVLSLIDLCISSSEEEELIKGYFLMVYHGLNNGDSNLIDKYLAKLQRFKNSKNMAIIKRIEGVSYLIKSDFDKAIFTFNDSIELSAKLPKELAEVNLVACYAYLGEAYIYTKQYKRAIKDLERGRKIVADSINFIRGSVLIYTYLAICNYFLDDKVKAKNFIDRATYFFDNSLLCWKRTLCYIFAKWIYEECEIDGSLFDSKIEFSKIKYHNDLEKKIYKIYTEKLEK